MGSVSRVDGDLKSYMYFAKQIEMEELLLSGIKNAFTQRILKVVSLEGLLKCFNFSLKNIFPLVQQLIDRKADLAVASMVRLFNEITKI
jgi:hypothetical protein